ncbi:MAG: JAB domain-containing protein [Erysipelotrichaceae bacterium]
MNKNKYLTVLTTENIKAYRDKYYDFLLKRRNELYIEKYSRVFTKEEMEKFSKKEIDELFDISKISSHSMEVPTSKEDITPWIKDIIHLDTEVCILLILSEKNEIIRKKVFDSGNVTDTGVTPEMVLKYIIKRDIKRFMIVHNHPMSISAIFSESDCLSDFAVMAMGKTLGVKLVDSGVVTEFDYVSRYQEEKDPKNAYLYKENKKNKVLGEICSEDCIKKIKETNVWLGFWLNTLRYRL